MCFQLLVLSVLHYGVIYGQLPTLSEMSEFRRGSFEIYVYFGLLYPACTRWGTYIGCCSQRGRNSELRLRRGGWQAAHTVNNPQVEGTGVLLCVIREYLQLQLNCIGDKSRQRGSSLPLTLTDRPASFSVAQSLFEIHNRLQLERKAATVTCVNPHVARAINT